MLLGWSPTLFLNVNKLFTSLHILTISFLESLLINLFEAMFTGSLLAEKIPRLSEPIIFATNLAKNSIDIKMNNFTVHQANSKTCNLTFVQCTGNLSDVYKKYLFSFEIIRSRYYEGFFSIVCMNTNKYKL